MATKRHTVTSAGLLYKQKDNTGSGILFHQFRRLLYVTRITEYPKTQEQSLFGVYWQSPHVLYAHKLKNNSSLKMKTFSAANSSVNTFFITKLGTIFEALKKRNLMIRCGISCGHIYCRPINWWLQRQIHLSLLVVEVVTFIWKWPLFSLYLMNLMAST